MENCYVAENEQRKRNKMEGKQKIEVKITRKPRIGRLLSKTPKDKVKVLSFVTHI